MAFEVNDSLFTFANCKHEKELKGKSVRGETSHRAQGFFKPTSVFCGGFFFPFLFFQQDEK